MVIVLQILKIIGIVLLGLLLLAFGLLLLLLFVPVRYKVSGKREEGDTAPIRLKVKVTWLLHLLNIIVQYPEPGYVRIRLLLFAVKKIGQKEEAKPAKKKRRIKARKDTGPDREETEEGTDIESRDQEEGSFRTQDAETEKEEKIRSGRNNDETEKEEEKDAGSGFWEKAEKILTAPQRFFQKIQYTIQKIYDKIIDIREHTERYVQMLKDPGTQAVLKKSGNHLLIILKSILPKKCKVNLHIGMEDPAATGQILSYVALIYPWIYDKVTITPDFENKVIEGDFVVKGRIIVIVLLVRAVVFYKAYKLFKKEAA